MGRAELRPEKIPVNLPGESVIARKVNIGGDEYEITCVSMGNPHAVVFQDNLDDLDLNIIGPLFENDALFPDRVNAEFVKVVARNRIKVRLWERGSGETQASGTAACASAVAAMLNGYCDQDTDIKVQLPGGDLTIRYTDEAVYMTGDCIKVFDGTVEI
jgi:carbamoyl-phosphate synthase large subunit